MVAVNGDMECRYTVNDTDRCRYTVNDTVRGRYTVNDTLHYSTKVRGHTMSAKWRRKSVI